MCNRLQQQHNAPDLNGERTIFLPREWKRGPDAVSIVVVFSSFLPPIKQLHRRGVARPLVILKRRRGVFVRRVFIRIFNKRSRIYFPQKKLLH